MGIQSTIRAKIIHVPIGTCSPSLHIPQNFATKSFVNFLFHAMPTWYAVHFRRSFPIQVSIHSDIVFQIESIFYTGQCAGSLGCTSDDCVWPFNCFQLECSYLAPHFYHPHSPCILSLPLAPPGGNKSIHWRCFYRR